MRISIELTIVALIVSACATPSQMIADAEVKRLCAIDGGIKVYETVELPAAKFNQWGQVNFYRPTQGENALGLEYGVKKSVQYIQKGSPSLHRFHVQVIRRYDGKLLGESVGYSRGGGDISGPWQPSSYSCPSEYGDVPLLKKIFVRSDKE